MSSGISARIKILQIKVSGGIALSAFRKIVMPVTALFLGVSAMFMAAGTAGGESDTTNTENDYDWHATRP